MQLRKTRGVPGAAPGGYVWNTEESVVEVPDWLGLDLVAVPGAGFQEVLPEPEPNPEPDPEPAVEDGAAEAEPVPAVISDDEHIIPADAVSEAPKRRGRPPKNTVAE